MSIITPYYRTIVERNVTECSEEPDFTYDPYKLFCLRTKINPVIIKMFGPGVDIRFITVQKHNKMYMTLTIVKNDQIPTASNPDPVDTSIELTESQIEILQRYVDEFTSDDIDTCLILSSDGIVFNTDNKPLPTGWVRSMLPYIELNETVNSFANDYGLFGVFNQYIDYLNTYNQVLQQAIERLQYFYNMGYIIYASTIKDSWDLEPVDSDGIVYSPRWQDERFAKNMVEFLQSRIRGDEHINLMIGDSYVQRHFIAKDLCDVLGMECIKSTFSNCYVKIIARDLSEARSISSIVFLASAKAVGRVFIIKLSSLSLGYMYGKIYDEIKTNVDYTWIIYHTDDYLYPYTFSGQIDYNDDENEFIELIINKTKD